MTSISEVLRRNDVPYLHEVHDIALAIRDGDTQDICLWLNDLACGDGTNNEAKLAAILRGVLLSMPASPRPE